MAKTQYAGIDYSMGRANVDAKAGIHYGVISQHAVGEHWYDSAEPDYGKPTCPECGSEVTDTLPDNWKELNLESHSPHGCDDYVCLACKLLLDSSEVTGEEPIGWSFEDGEYTLTDCLDSDVFVLKSPYFTFAQFCSPCVPGAGNLESPCDDGPKTYCLGHDWFEDGRAPYTVFSVATGEQVQP